jgi:hypothetical protein
MSLDDESDTYTNCLQYDFHIRTRSLDANRRLVFPYCLPNH